jgi:hypothetical protein
MEKENEVVVLDKEEIEERNAEVGWRCNICDVPSEDEMFAYHEVKYHKDFGTLCLNCYANQVIALGRPIL